MVKIYNILATDKVLLLVVINFLERYWKHYLIDLVLGGFEAIVISNSGIPYWGNCSFVAFLTF